MIGKETQGSQSGFTLTEMLLGFAITGFIFAGVFTALGQFMLFSTQDEINQNLREDLLLTMGRICKEVNLSTNVVPRAGGLATDNTTLVLRQPILDASGEIQADSFRYVTFSLKSGVQERGLVRQVWATETSEEAEESEILNDSIVALGFLFAGKPISQVTNLTVVRDLEIVVVSARETGLQLPHGATIDPEMYSDLTVLDQMLDYGVDFPSLRSYIDSMNSNRMDVTIAATMGAATMRNKKALGLKTPASPYSPSS